MDVTIHNSFNGFTKRCERLTLSYSHFRYFQVHNFAKLYNSAFPNTPPVSGINVILGIHANQKSLISKIYVPMSQLREIPLERIRKHWEALSRVNGSCTPIHSRVPSPKYIPVSQTPVCYLSAAYITHTFWACPRLHDYQTNIFTHLSKILSATLSLGVEVGIFGKLPKCDNLGKQAKDMIAFASLLACRRILLGWKLPLAPTASTRLKDLMFFLNREFQIQPTGVSEEI